MLRGGESFSHSTVEVCNGDRVNQVLAVLVVDDNYTNRNILKTMIQKLFNITPTLAETGKEAVDLYSSDKFFHLVFMDMEMPVLNGAQATEQLRAMGAKSMIVGVSADKEYEEKFKSAGADKFLEKPLTLPVLKEVMEEYNKKYADICNHCHCGMYIANK